MQFIAIGAWKNTRLIIRRKVDGETLADLELLDILSPNKQVKVVIQRTRGNFQNTSIEMSNFRVALCSKTNRNIRIVFIFFFEFELYKVD